MTGARTTDNPSPPPLIRRPRAVYMVLALALAAVFLTLALRGVDFGAMFRTIRHAQPAPLLLVQAVFFCALLTRSIRWRVLLSGRKPVGFAHVFWATSAGYLGNNFLPLRAGEVLRTALIGRTAGIQTSYVLATAVIERVGDTLILLLAIPFFLSRIAGLPAGFEQKLQWITVVLMAGVGILPFALRHSHRLEGLIARLPVPARLHSTITRLMAGFTEGLGSLYSPQRALLFVVLSIAAWTCDTIIATIIADALRLHLGYRDAFTLLALLGFGSALPSTPGYVGIYQLVAVTVLTPLGFTRADALALILVFQASMYVGVSLWGSIGLYKLRR